MSLLELQMENKSIIMNKTSKNLDFDLTSKLEDWLDLQSTLRTMRGSSIFS